MKKIIVLISLFVAFSLSAQTFEVPKDYSLDTKEDYTKYEPEIVNCINWLINTPINQDIEKRKNASAFLITWVSGCPDILVSIDSKILTFMNEDNPDLLVVFVGGWVKESINSNRHKKESDDATAYKEALLYGNLAGIDAVIEFYNSNKKFIPKNKGVENYIKLKKKGKLKEYIESKI